MIALLVACVALLTVVVILLIVVAVLFWRAVNADARKRGMLDAVDLLHRRKRWYS